MNTSLQAYVRKGHHTLRKWALDPKLHTAVRSGAYVLSGFGLSAASLGNSPQPFAMALVCACSGWSAVLAALGAGAGYLLFWGSTGHQCVIWTLLALAVALLLGDRRLCRQTPLLLPACAGLIVAASGVIFQSLSMESAPIALYLLRVGLGAAGAWLFARTLEGRNPVLDWMVWGIAVLSLAQIVPISWLSLGFPAAGAMMVAGPFPAAALGGLALDLAQVTAVPMTAVMATGFILRFLPRCPKWVSYCAPAAMYLAVMALCGTYDLQPLPGLLLGGIIGTFLPSAGQVAHRRGETGAAQVRLEMAAGVLAQTEQLLLEVPVTAVDEPALIARAAERACGSCPCRKGCKDAKRIAQLPAALLHKPLLSTEEIPIVCRKSGRFLAELHRSQEQLRSIRADRERQREYRAAVVQQYRFLSEYLQELSDLLSKRMDPYKEAYSPEVNVYGNRPEADNGDRCLRFAGTKGRYYVLLCDGMGTGLGAVQEGRTAGTMLRRLLSSGYPAEHALRSLNSLCALRERAGAVTADIAELELDSGKVRLYKWGAAPSYLVSSVGVQKIGFTGPPPGLSVTDCQEQVERLTMRRGEFLLLVSDGVEEELVRTCVDGTENTSGEIAIKLMTQTRLTGDDDATIAVIRLNNK